MASHKKPAKRARTRKAAPKITNTVVRQYLELNGTPLHPGSASVLVVEEASEMIQEYAKAQRFGWESPNPTSGTTPKLLFMAELGQLAATTKMLLDMMPEDSVEVHVFTTALQDKLQRHIK